MPYSAYIAAHRFGLGASQNEIASISRNPKQWVKQQLDTQKADKIKNHIGKTSNIIKKYNKLGQLSAEQRQNIIKNGVNLYQKEMAERFKVVVSSQKSVLERFVLFWSNHFTVSFKGKPHLAPIMGAFEREAIRPHILGNFADMLTAVTQHPAMLIYLDNIQSIGPNSRAGKKRQKGLNENLAREILELHTLGVNGGYTQDDVIGLAKILTGWMLTPPRLGGGGFQYIDWAHEPGAHKLLGKAYSEKGLKQGMSALNDLSMHTSTARFLATKLARHFISDTPPEHCIKKLETAYLKSGGNLREVYNALIVMPEAWSDELPKIKKPYEMIIASFRMTKANPNPSTFEHVLKSLTLFDQAPFQAPSPAGWSDKADDWLSPNAMLNRVEWCHAFAQAIRPKGNPAELAKAIFADKIDKQTLFWINQAPTPEDGLALILASPTWQRR